MDAGMRGIRRYVRQCSMHVSVSIDCTEHIGRCTLDTGHWTLYRVEPRIVSRFSLCGPQKHLQKPTHYTTPSTTTTTEPQYTPDISPHCPHCPHLPSINPLPSSTYSVPSLSRHSLPPADSRIQRRPQCRRRPARFAPIWLSVGLAVFLFMVCLKT